MGIRYLVSFCKVLYRLVFWGAVAGFGITAIGVACLMIKLMYSPLNLKFIKSNVEQGLTQAVPNLKFQIGKLQLARTQKNFRLVIRAKGVKVIGTNTQQPIFSVPRMDLQLSTKTIFTGEFLPRSITIYGAKLKVSKDQNGTFSVDFKPEDSDFPPTPTNWSELSELIAHSNSLKHIRILDGTIIVEHQALNTSWTLNNVETHFGRIGLNMSLKASAKFKNTRLTCAGTLTPDGNASTPKTFQLNIKAALEQLPFNQLRTLWPEFLASLPRKWVLGNLSDGLVSYADIKTHLQLDLEQPQDPIHIRSLGGKILFSDMTVDYFEGFPKVRHVDGQATYDQKNFYIQTKSGTVEGLTIHKSDITIANLDQEDQHMTIDLDISGPLKDALKIIDTEPLGLAKKFGVDIAKVSGENVTHVHFAFPVETTLTTDQVDVKATSKLENVDIPNALASSKEGPKFHLSKGIIDLNVSKEQLQASGKVLLNGVPADLVWTEKFAPTKTWHCQYKVKSTLEGKQLADLLPGCLSGRTSFQLTLNKYKNDKSTLEIKANLKEATLSIPDGPTLKSNGKPCSTDVLINLKKDSIAEIPRLHLTGENVNIRASVKMNPVASQVESIHCDPLQIHATDIKVNGQRGSDGVFRLRLKGTQFDLEPFLAHHSENQNDRDFPFPVQVDLTFERVKFADQKLLSNVQGHLKHSQKEWRNIHLSGNLPGQTNGKNNFLQITRKPSETKDKLSIQSNDAGAVMHLFGISDSARQGQLRILGEKNENGSWMGTIKIDQFHLSKAPVMTQLLSLSSPFGLFDALSGHSVAFDQFQSKFGWRNGKILLKEGRASGTSLGFTVEGYINRNEDTLKLQGAVLPYNAVNIFLLKIPIVGQLLGGEQGGIWGISYTLKGSTADPKVTVNPFSALTPGFLRFIFEPSINEDPEDDDFMRDQATAPVRSPHQKQAG